METIKPGIFFDDSFHGICVGALVFPHGTIYIDSPLRAEDTRKWRNALMNQRGGSNKLVVLLDSHIDRTIGARALECTVLAHQKTAQVFQNRPSVFKGQSLESGGEWEAFSDTIGTRWAPPDITFTNTISLHWGGPQVNIEHHPGPTPGSSWAVIPDEKVIFIGDAVLLNQPPFFANADLDEWIQVLEYLISKHRNYLTISARGGEFTPDVTRSQLRLLKKLNRHLNKLALKNAPPESTEKLISMVLDIYEFPNTRLEKYTERLRTGLYQYYLRHYHPPSADEDIMIEDEQS